MFCPNCGKQINDGADFCPECGKSTSQNKGDALNSSGRIVGGVTNSPDKKEVFVRGLKCAGAGKYYAFTYFIPLLVVILGAALFEPVSWLGCFLIIAGIVFGIFARMIFKRSIMYDEEKKSFVFNAHSHLKFSMKSIDVGELSGIRVRYVKIGYSAARFSLNDPGKYHVICFDSAYEGKSFSVWFSKNGNAEEFMPVIEYAFQKNGSGISVDKKDELMKLKDFENESNS